MQFAGKELPRCSCYSAMFRRHDRLTHEPCQEIAGRKAASTAVEGASTSSV